MLAAADTIAAALADSRGTLVVPLAAFGNSTIGPDLHGAYQRSIEQAGKTSERLLEVLEGDVDRLYRVAFAYQEMEDRHTDLVGRTPGIGQT